MPWKEGYAPQLQGADESTMRKRKYHIAATVHQESYGHITTAQDFLKDILTPGRLRGMTPVVETLQLHDDLSVFGQACCDSFREAVAVLRSRLPESESLWAYQTIHTILGGLAAKGPGFKRLVRKLVGLADKPLEMGTERWRILQENAKAAFFVRFKAAYKNKVTVKYPGIVDQCHAMWRENCRASSHASDVQIKHDQPGHTYPKGCVPRTRLCPRDANDNITCSQEQTYYMDGSEDEVYDQAMLTCSEEWRGKIKRYFFKLCRPWYVKADTLRTCACKHHNQMRYLMEDLSKFILWDVVHRDCGEGADRDGSLACKCSDMCKSGDCKRVFKDRALFMKYFICTVIEHMDGAEGGPGHRVCKGNACAYGN